MGNELLSMKKIVTQRWERRIRGACERTKVTGSMADKKENKKKGRK
jgi:hypothetical protein